MNIDHVRSWIVPPVEQKFTAKDSMLYALGLGFGSDPIDEDELRFVFEDGLRTVPSICNTLSHPGFWLKEPSLEIDWVKVLHGEQSFVMHEPLSAPIAVRGEYRIVGVQDKGAGKGAVLMLEKRLLNRDDGRLHFTVGTTLVLRGDGGSGEFGNVPPPPPPLPERAPDLVVELTTMPQIALLYRLNGDYNPIHASPGLARSAGFDRPILQGLCTMGIATRALLKGVCEYDPNRLHSMFVRFSQPVYPGETIATEIFLDGANVRFRCRAVERGVTVLDRGEAHIR